MTGGEKKVAPALRLSDRKKKKLLSGVSDVLIEVRMY